MDSGRCRLQGILESWTDGQPTLQNGETDEASAAFPSPRGDGGEPIPVDDDSNIIRGED